MLTTYIPPRDYVIPEVSEMPDTANIELIIYKLDDLAKQISRMDINQTAALKKLEDRIEYQEQQIRSLEDYRLRAQTVTVPVSIAFSTALGVAVKFALDAILK
jgi:hypothetical protein